MARPKKVPELTPPDGLVLPPRSQWPKLSAADRRIVKDYLIGWLAVAVEAQEQSTRMRAMAPNTPGFPERVDYWSHVVSGIHWLISHVDHRQAYLAIAAMLAEHNGKGR